MISTYSHLSTTKGQVVYSKTWYWGSGNVTCIPPNQGEWAVENYQCPMSLSNVPGFAVQSAVESYWKAEIKSLKAFCINNCIYTNQWFLW